MHSRRLQNDGHAMASQQPVSMADDHGPQPGGRPHPPRSGPRASRSACSSDPIVLSPIDGLASFFPTKSTAAETFSLTCFAEAPVLS